MLGSFVSKVLDEGSINSGYHRPRVKNDCCALLSLPAGQ